MDPKSALGNGFVSIISGGCNFHKPVDLAISELPASREWKMAGQVLYHTSIIIGAREYAFGSDGLQCRVVANRFDIPPSHFGKDRSMVFEVGQTQKTGDDLSEVLKPYFQQDSYDLVCKNCNSFTDCALAFLLSRRLPKKYSMTESLGKDLPRITSLLTDGRYKPNPKAQKFNLDKVVLHVDPNAWMGTASPLSEFSDAPVTPKAKGRRNSVG
jgi:hypothetical protein